MAYRRCCLAGWPCIEKETSVSHACTATPDTLSHTANWPTMSEMLVSPKNAPTSWKQPICWQRTQCALPSSQRTSDRRSHWPSAPAASRTRAGSIPSSSESMSSIISRAFCVYWCDHASDMLQPRAAAMRQLRASVHGRVHGLPPPRAVLRPLLSTILRRRHCCRPQECWPRQSPAESIGS